MTSGLLQAKVEGLDSLENEFETEFMPRVNKAVTAGLNAVASDLTASLQRHIQTEVYDAYKPKNWIGSKNDSGMTDSKFMNYAVHGQTLIFDYEIIPSPSEWRNPPIEELNFANGDDIIKSIQSGGDTPIYGVIKSRPPRPFWTNFINDMFESGDIDKTFANGMNAYDSELQARADKKVTLEAQDREQMTELEQEPSDTAEKVQYE